METIDCGGNFNLNDNNAVKPPPEEPMVKRINTKKQDGNFVQKILKPTKKPDTDPDSVKKHQELTLMLSRYGTSPRFGSYLKSLTFELTPAKLKKLTVDKLEDMLERVRVSVANKTVSDIWTSSIMAGVAMVENVCANTKLNDKIKLRGLSEALSEDENFLDLLEELKLNNQNLSYVSPYTRLTYTLLTSVMRVHGLNTMLDKRNKKNVNVTKHKMEVGAPPPPEASSKHDHDDTSKVKNISTKKRRVPPDQVIYELD